MLFAKIGKSLKTKDKSLKFFFAIPFDFRLLSLDRFRESRNTKSSPDFSEKLLYAFKNNLYYFFAMNSCT